MHGFKSFPKKTELEFTNGINIILGPNGSGKCLTGDSLITLSNGEQKRIDNIVNSRLSNSTITEDGYIIPGDGTEVECLNLDTLKIESAKIKSFVKRTSPKKILSIKTRSGRFIKTTKYHPLFILKDNQVVEARADELKQGVKIAVPRKLNFIPEHKFFIELLDEIKEDDKIYIPYNEDYKLILLSIKSNLTWQQLANKIGVSFYVIKGLLDKQSINLFYLIKILRYANLSDLEMIKIINQLVSNGKKTNFNFHNSPEFSRFFGYLLAEGRLANSSQIWFTNGDKEIVEDYIQLVKKLFNKSPLVREYKPRCWDVIIFSEPLKKILNKLGMSSNTGNKKISNSLLKHSSEKEISELLSGLYCGDGYVSKSSIEITTKSQKLARGIEICLLRLGVLFSTRDQIKCINSSGFSGNYKTIVISGVDNFRKFNNNIKLVHQSKNNRILNYLSKKSNPNLDLIEINNLVKEISKEQNINIKSVKKQFPILDSYCYNQCTPSRNGLQLLSNKLFKGNSLLIEKLKLLTNSDIFWDEITQINEIDGEEWVYDLCIDKHHNFIANNLFVHNSNVSDALCFVLGRLSAKSMRAAKSGNLIFMGTKATSPSKEASVELIFDNKDKIFSIEKNEISIKRIVRRNGQSVYKINNDVKTRQDILVLLAQAGIDPNGFNIILQGEIQNFVKMHTEERRKIIEEVSGISIYEIRKVKALRELDKTEDRLKEVSAILRERTIYLNNLEKERQQALKFKKLEADVKKFKASIISYDINLKKKEIEKIDSEISKALSQIDKIKKSILSIQTFNMDFEEKIKQTNSKIKQSTGFEQEKINQEIADLRATLEGSRVRTENYEKRISEISRQKIDLKNSILESEETLRDLKKNLPEAKKQEDIIKRKKKLEEIEQQRKKFYMLKSEIKTIKELIEDKESILKNYERESEFLINQIETLFSDIFDKKTTTEKLNELKSSLLLKKESLEKLNKKEIDLDKIMHVNNYEIKSLHKLKEDISRLDICPLCKNKITTEHIKSINSETNPKIEKLQKEIDESSKEIKDIEKEREEITSKIGEITSEISKREKDITILRNIDEKTEQIKSLQEKIDKTKQEFSQLKKRKTSLENNFDENSDIDQKYETLQLEIQEIFIRSEETIDSEISFKQREVERIKVTLKQLNTDETDFKEELEALEQDKEDKESVLEEKRNQADELEKRFKKLISERDNLQSKIHENEMEISRKQNEIHNLEQITNNLKIAKAKFDAEFENLEIEMLGFQNIEIIKINRDTLLEKLNKTQEILFNIGSVNLRSLEVYDSIKKEYDSIKEKVELIDKEKNNTLKIIHEIDIKKKKTFNKTLDALNEIFSRNFTQLSTKGQVYLDLENRKDPFDGGVSIVVKTGHGKYFDVTSLSGGEQTLVALSLIFAIQEYKPYFFYILDEIDAALDKRNSQRLSELLKRYMKKGQYIIISHNDEIISNSTALYGISMHEGISKIVSLKI